MSFVLGTSFIFSVYYFHPQLKNGQLHTLQFEIHILLLIIHTYTPLDRGLAYLQTYHTKSLAFSVYQYNFNIQQFQVTGSKTCTMIKLMLSHNGIFLINFFSSMCYLCVVNSLSFWAKLMQFVYRHNKRVIQCI